MKGARKYSTRLLVAVVFCAIGMILLIAQKFIDTDVDLFTLALAFNAIGLFAFMFGRKSGASS